MPPAPQNKSMSLCSFRMVYPSLSFEIGQASLRGLHGLWSHTPERSGPSTLLPAAASSHLVRCLFFPIFCFQNRTLEEGRCPREQGSPMPKHPLTNTTLRLEGNTRSGVPVKSFRCSLKRYPSRWSIDRIKSSGPVSRPRMRDIMRLRCSGGNMSIDVGNFRRWSGPDAARIPPLHKAENKSS